MFIQCMKGTFGYVGQQPTPQSKTTLSVANPNRPGYQGAVQSRHPVCQCPQLQGDFFPADPWSHPPSVLATSFRLSMFWITLRRWSAAADYRGGTTTRAPTNKTRPAALFQTRAADPHFEQQALSATLFQSGNNSVRGPASTSRFIPIFHA